MHTRKLVKAGSSSHTISLPSNWLQKHNLKKGDILHIKETEKELIITQESEPKKENKEKTIDITNKPLDVIGREITSAYVNNYSTINITGNNLNENLSEIRRMLHNFVALEIAEQTSNKIIAKDLLNPKEISIQKTIRRMDIIIRSMVEDIVSSFENKHSHESISFRDQDINRLYFLLFRILRSALNDSKISSIYNLTNSQVLSYWYLIINLESIADNIKKISEVLTDIKHEIKDSKKVFTDMNSDYLEAMKALYNKDYNLAQEVASKRASRIKECTEQYRKSNKAEIAEVMINLREIEDCICNISRIVIDDEGN